MSRMTLMNVPLDQHDEVNAYLVGLFDDDPGSDELDRATYVDGGNQFVQTRCFSTISLSAGKLTSIQAYFGGRTDCLVADYATSPPQDWWAVAFGLWAIKPVV